MNKVNGGVLREDTYIDTSKVPTTIDVMLNHVVTRPYDDIYFQTQPSSMDNFYLFRNGTLLYPEKDYLIGSDLKLNLLHDLTHDYGDYFYAFENMNLSEGCLKNRFRQPIDIDKKKIEGLEGIKSNSYVLVFYNGNLIFHDQYAPQPEDGVIKFIFTLEQGKYLDITQLIPSVDSNLELMFAGTATYSSSYVQVQGIDTKNCYLVFYDGKLMSEDVNYTLQKNLIIFKNGLVLDVNKKLVVLRV